MWDRRRCATRVPRSISVRNGITALHPAIFCNAAVCSLVQVKRPAWPSKSLSAHMKRCLTVRLSPNRLKSTLSPHSPTFSPGEEESFFVRILACLWGPQCGPQGVVTAEWFTPHWRCLAPGSVEQVHVVSACDSQVNRRTCYTLAAYTPPLFHYPVGSSVCHQCCASSLASTLALLDSSGE